MTSHGSAGVWTIISGSFSSPQKNKTAPGNALVLGAVEGILADSLSGHQ